ncbi:MAG: FtsX-like permease family protein [Acidimicrobiales bacterium]
MGAVWYHARAELRRRWRASLLLVLLVAVAGATVLTAWAGARRSSTAYERFREETLSSDMDIAFDGAPAELDPAALRALKDLPQIEAITESTFPFVVPAGSGFYPYLDFLAYSPVDDVALNSIDRPRILDGRLPSPDAVDEAAILDLYADEAGLQVGDELELESFRPDQLEPLFTTGDAGPPAGPRVTVRVTSIIAAPTFLSESVGSFVPRLFLTPAFGDAHADDMAAYPGGFTARLRNGADDGPAVEAAVREIFADEEGLEITHSAEVDERIQASIDVIVGALLVTALLAAVAGLVAIGQGFARHASHDHDGQRDLAALGMTRRERRGALALGLVPAIVGGVALAVGLSVVASALLPVGIARRAEPDKGIDVDSMVLVLGTAGLLLVLTAIALLAAIPASRASRRAAAAVGDRQPSRSMRALRVAGLAPPATIGVGMVLDPRDGTAWSVRSALGGFAFGITGLVAVLVMAASLTTTVDSPVRYGTFWDTAVPGFGGEIVEALRDPLAEDGDVDSLGILTHSIARVDGQETNVHAFEAVKGQMSITMLAGRPPTHPGEVALGTTTMRESDSSIGSTVEIEGPDSTTEVTVVGRAAFPVVDERSAVGRGVLMSNEEIGSVAPADTFNYDLVIDWGDGVDVDQKAATLSEEANVEVTAPRLPSDVNNLKQVEVLPRTLAILMALLALLVLLHALVATTRARQRDLAVLRTLGFERRHLSATVAWQATAIALLGVLLGGVIGIGVGRLVWTAIARNIGVVEDPTMPIGLLALMAVVAVAAGIAAATIPARSARRVKPATILRAG